jgi:outer membrane murein-binding lipoprotein Lpp
MLAASVVSRRLHFALLLVGAVAVSVMVTSHAASSAETPPNFNTLSTQVTQLSTQMTTLQTQTLDLTEQIVALRRQITPAIATLDQVDSNVNVVNGKVSTLSGALHDDAVDILSVLNVLESVENSTHDRLSALCRTSISALSAIYFFEIGNEAPYHIAGCWKHYYLPPYDETFDSKWNDPNPPIQ